MVLMIPLIYYWYGTKWKPQSPQLSKYGKKTVK
jgi:hypothetical protein